MPGPISTNAPFTEFGNSMILRDIEQLYLLVGQTTGDVGKQTVKSSDTSGNSPTTPTTPPASVYQLKYTSILTPAINGAIAPLSITLSTVYRDDNTCTIASNVVTPSSGTYEVSFFAFMSIYIPTTPYSSLYGSVSFNGSFNGAHPTQGASINLVGGATASSLQSAIAMKYIITFNGAQTFSLSFSFSSNGIDAAGTLSAGVLSFLRLL